MNNPAPAVDPLEVFELRAWARARLCAEGMLERHEAIDVLQQAAGGLIDTIGQDRVQEILAAAFKEAR